MQPGKPTISIIAVLVLMNIVGGRGQEAADFDPKSVYVGWYLVRNNHPAANQFTAALTRTLGEGDMAEAKRFLLQDRNDGYKYLSSQYF